MNNGTQTSEARAVDIRAMLAGFPAAAVAVVMEFHDSPTAENLDAALREVIEFYLPRAHRRALAGLPAETRLREDLGVDSLTLAELAFKCDELFGISIETREVAGVRTLGDLLAFVEAKLREAR